MLKSVSFFLAFVLATSAAAQIRCSDGLEPIDRQADARLSPMDFIRNVTANEVVFAKAFAGFGHKLEDRKSTRLNSSHIPLSRMPSSA